MHHIVNLEVHFLKCNFYKTNLLEFHSSEFHNKNKRSLLNRYVLYIQNIPKSFLSFLLQLFFLVFYCHELLEEKMNKKVKDSTKKGKKPNQKGKDSKSLLSIRRILLPLLLFCFFFCFSFLFLLK